MGNLHFFFSQEMLFFLYDSISGDIIDFKNLHEILR